MEGIIVGIDVSKDRLDVGLRPSGERFAVERNSAGLDLLVPRLKELSPHIVALEATGGFETIVAAALAAAIVAAGGDATFKSRLVALGVESTPMTTAQFSKFVTDEIGKWAKVVKFAAIKAD